MKRKHPHLSKRTVAISKFLLPSFVGIFSFLIPFRCSGSTQTLVIHLSRWLHQGLADCWPWLLTTLLIFTVFFTTLATWVQYKPLLSRSWLRALLQVSKSALGMRIVGMVLALLALTGIGQRWLPATLYATDGVFFDLLPLLFANLLCGLFFAPLLMEFGLMEFVGLPMNRMMRPLFCLPGRAAVDCLASWIGDGTMGTLLSLQEYEKGRYTAKEAGIVVTCFSIVSVTFCVALLERLQLAHHFAAFYATVLTSSLVAAVVMPRIPPLVHMTETYIDGNQRTAQATQAPKANMWRQTFDLALKRAAKQVSLRSHFAKIGINYLQLIVGTLPSVLTLATLAFCVLEVGVVKLILKAVGKPFALFLQWGGIPAAERAAETFFVGFVDMLIPTMMIKELEGPAYELTRFVVGTLSVVQLVYLTELAPLLLRSKLKFSLAKLFAIFLLRTVLTLPVIVCCARLFIR